MALASLPSAAHAQTPAVQPSKDSEPSDMLTDGEVKKVDQALGKVTIKHAEIKHLDMPGMTMVFTAKDKAVLAKVQAGDKIRFGVINSSGKYVVTVIQVIP